MAASPNVTVNADGKTAPERVRAIRGTNYV